MACHYESAFRKNLWKLHRVVVAIILNCVEYVVGKEDLQVTQKETTKLEFVISPF